MKDEEFVFRQDVKEKSSTARSARNRRTHNGKGGRVKFPSDNLTRKELNAMNGEVKSYRLNDPMNWKEFKQLPDDVKIMYIKALKQKWNVPSVYIAQMLGCSQSCIFNEITRLGIGNGRSNKGQRRDWKKEEFLAWCNGAPVPAADPVEEDPEAERQMASLEEIAEPVPVPEVKVLPIREGKPKATPCSGNLIFEGKVENVLNSISVLLGGAFVHINITWDVLPEPVEGRLRENG